jgi:hypothetical protein
MRKIYLPLSLVSLAVLGACATSDPVTPAPAPVVVTPPPAVVAVPPPPATVVVPPATTSTAPVVVATPALRAGEGRIISITALPPSAAAGGSSKMQRIGIRMNDGVVQYVDTAAEGLFMDQRVELTMDGQIRR